MMLLMARLRLLILINLDEKISATTEFIEHIGGKDQEIVRNGLPSVILKTAERTGTVMAEGTDAGKRFMEEIQHNPAFYRQRLRQILMPA